MGILLLLISKKRWPHVWEDDGEVDILALNELNGGGVHSEAVDVLALIGLNSAGA